MKRKVLAGLLAASLCISATGCANPMNKPASEAEQTAQSEQTAAAAADHMILDGIKGEAGVVDKTPEELKKDAREAGISYAYEENCNIGGEDVSGENTSLYLQRYELYLREDGTAKLYDISDYGNGHVMTSEYLGEGEVSEKSAVFSFKDSDSDTGRNIYVFDLDGDKVTKVVYRYQAEDFQNLEGTYKAETEKYGMTTVAINRFGDATLTTEDGKQLTGNICKYENKYDLMVNNEDYTESIDWVVEFDGDTFTYEEYQTSINKGYAGTYSCFGSLGEFKLVVDEQGSATATVKIDGKECELTGTASIDYENNQISGAYLSDEEGHALDLTLADWGDGTWNYSGSISTPLNAG